MKAIRVSIYVIAGLLVLLVLGVAVFAMTFNPNKYKGQIESLVKEKTGRTLSLKGDLEVAFYPALGAKVNGITFSERGSAENFVTLDSAHVSVALMPLLRGEAIVDKIRVSGLKARIVKEKDGTFNFSDLMQAKTGDPAAKAPEKGTEKKAEKAEKGEKAAVGFDIAGVQLDRSAVTYIDRASGQEIALNDIELSTGRIAEQADGKLSLKTAAKGKNPDLDLKVDIASGYKFDLPAKAFAISNLDAKLAGAAAGMKNLNVNAKGDIAANPEKNEYRVKGFSLDAKGQQEGQSLEARIAAPELVIAADTAKGGAVTADLRLKEAARDLEAKLKLSGVEGSAKALAIPQLSADIAMVEQGKPAVKIPITGSLKADLEKQTVNADLAAKFDESNIQAKLGLAKFTPPSYLFDINVDKINLDRYTGDDQKQKQKPAATPTEGKAPEKPAPQKKEEDTPVDLSFLKDLNANGRLQFGALQVKGLKLANLKAEVKAANGRLDVAPHSVNLYEGSASGAITAHADGRVAVKETLNGVAVGPLLRDFAQKDMLEGKGTVALDITAAGKTVNAMKKSLAGNARLQLKDGAVKGINLAEALRRAKTALGSQEARAAARQDQATDFSELKASFTIKNGVAHNEDLEMKAPLFRLTGRGDIDVGNGTIDYVTKAAVVATTKGQGGADLAHLAGVTVPVHLKGPFEDMKYDVNYSAVAADVAKTRVGEKVRSRLEERLGVSKPPAEGQAEGQGGSGSSRIDRLKGLLGR
ncbi:MAG TPA: AsmA family protein [Burkholderiales bacterium]|nr:AsmA family protein [Burkholderiales bacterium]